MRAILRGWQRYGCMVLALVSCAIFCFSPYGKVAAADAQTIDDRLSGSLQTNENTNGAQPQVVPVDSRMQDDGLTGVISDDIDGEDDLSLKRLPATSAKIGLNRASAEMPGAAESLSEEPQSPPPNVKLLTVDDTLLLASNATPTSETVDKAKTKPAPEPKTSKSSSVSTPLIVGAGIAIVAGAVALAGGGSDSDDPAPATPTTPSGDSGDTSSGNVEVIKLSSLVRIGDDTDYNAHHPDHFKQSHPSGTSWTDSFNVSNGNVKSAVFKYTVAGSKVANPVYINGKQAGRLCNPGNTAWNVESCSIGITGFVHSGSNEIKIKCAIDESDTDTPYDDVELYNLRIELTR